MKILLATLLVLFSFSGHAGPGDGPIVPWPTQSDALKILPEDIEGSWYSFDDNSEWLISIRAVSKLPEFFEVRIDSNSIFSKSAQGLFFIGPNGIWGALDIDQEHTLGVVIYRDKYGFRIRVSKDRYNVLEMDLYKMNSSSSK